MPANKKTMVFQSEFHNGKSFSSYEFLGAHKNAKKNKITFRVFAPNAECVSLAADFNGWKKNCSLDRETKEGLWSIELDAALFDGSDLYKYIITYDGKDTYKSDPYAFYYEMSPKTASRFFDTDYTWNDAEWLKFRKKNVKRPYNIPLNIYELHLGSWKKKQDGSSYSYREVAPLVASYVKEMGYTHILLLPIFEYAFDGSLGYSASGYFAPTSRFGSPDDFRYFVDYMHSAGVGVILDVPMSEPAKDVHGLCKFDGTMLYETDKQTFDISKNEVRNFVLSSLSFWLREYHVDGLKLCGAEYMLGNDFFLTLSEFINENYPDVVFTADKTEGFKGVTKPVKSGGLGFSHKLNLGWTEDVLEYIGVDPMFRKHHHEKLTFSTMYCDSDNFILPITHKDVVNGKKSLLDKSVGDYWQKFASTRSALGYMMTHPGKKMLFMGCEIGQFKEWDHNTGCEWFLLDYEMHSKLQTYIRDLNFVYLENPALWQLDNADGFEWIDEDNRDWSLLSYVRYNKKGEPVVVIVNLTPMGRYGYVCGVPLSGEYKELINGDNLKYGGTGMINPEYIAASSCSCDKMPYSLKIDIGPYGVVVLKHVKTNNKD